MDIGALRNRSFSYAKEYGLKENMGGNNMGYYSELDIALQGKIEEYEEIHGEYDYYGFKDGEIYGITQEDLDRELEKYEREIDEGKMEYYSLEEVDEMMSKRLNIKENENGD